MRTGHERVGAEPCVEEDAGRALTLQVDVEQARRLAEIEEAVRAARGDNGLVDVGVQNNRAQGLSHAAHAALVHNGRVVLIALGLPVVCIQRLLGGRGSVRIALGDHTGRESGGVTWLMINHTTSMPKTVSTPQGFELAFKPFPETPMCGIIPILKQLVVPSRIFCFHAPADGILRVPRFLALMYGPKIFNSSSSRDASSCSPNKLSTGRIKPCAVPRFLMVSLK